jgi:hypothetical protein
MNEHGVFFVGDKTARGKTEALGEKPLPVPLSPPQIPGLTSNQDLRFVPKKITL